MTANDLIGTKALPSQHEYVRAEARRALAYYNLEPYPIWAFAKWKTEEMGPLPRCRPFVQKIAKEGAEWLFSRPVQFRAEGHDELSKLINATWNANRMASKSLAWAVDASCTGGTVLKFSYDASKSEYPRITALSQSEQTRLYFDPHDTECLLMARIQYAYIDYTEKGGRWMWYREEWTDDEYVLYDPIPVSSGVGVLAAAKPNPYDYVGAADQSAWVVQKREPNPFKIIPVWLVKNRLSSDWYGMGDLWELYSAVDQINFTRDLGHKDNQKRVNPKVNYIDLEVPENESAQGTTPGRATVLESSGDNHQGKIEVVELQGRARPDIDKFADDLLRELYDAAGVTGVNPEEITNKGAMTASVIRLLFDSIIKTTEQKRRLYGEDGYCMFFERMLTGMTNIGVWNAQAGVDVQCLWPSIVALTPLDLQQTVSTFAQMIAEGFTTRERATRAIATMTDVNDPDALLEEATREYEARTAQAASEPVETPGGNGEETDNGRTLRAENENT
jgi:hypothetical protein